MRQSAWCVVTWKLCTVSEARKPKSSMQRRTSPRARVNIWLDSVLMAMWLLSLSVYSTPLAILHLPTTPLPLPGATAPTPCAKGLVGACPNTIQRPHTTCKGSVTVRGFCKGWVWVVLEHFFLDDGYACVQTTLRTRYLLVMSSLKYHRNLVMDRAPMRRVRLLSKGWGIA